MEAGMRAHGFEDDPRVAEIGELYEAMLRGPMTVEELGRLAGYSKRTLQRLFREYVGVTPKWVLSRFRLHEAADRMADGEHDWPRLALELGFFDQAHFIKAFKAVIGRSPADYGLKTSTM
jgi:transcriptional regulator GlxA family with amidase domain